jgi:thiol:disulfide interchange protein/DsbC/DsbD-like thiol-disulfide interchange protein
MYVNNQFPRTIVICITYLITLLLLLVMTSPAFGQVFHGKFIEAELISEHRGVHAGIDASVALRLKPDDGWHVYWRYAGDSGAAPILIWQVDGQSVETEISWPTPEALPFGQLTNYGYSSEVLLLSTLPIAKTAEDNIKIHLDAEWLVCMEECIPGNALFELTLPVLAEDEVISTAFHAELFKVNRAKLPEINHDFKVSAGQLSSGNFLLSFNANKKNSITAARFFPLQGGIINNSAAQKFNIQDNSYHLELIPAATLVPDLTILNGIITLNGADDLPASIAVAPQISTATLHKQNLGSLGSAETILGLLFILGTAFLGGLILNLMPCVFPVLSIKILEFVKKAGSDSKNIRKHGFFFTAGVLLSFWTLAFTIRILRSTGEHLGWGFQLQNPIFVTFLILLIIAFAINLFGVFELGFFLQRASGDALNKIHAKNNSSRYFSSFWHGALATILATPCTAPFMGVALAYALSASAFTSYLVFTMLALGLAAPYLLLSLYPNLLSALPRPGIWMERFKQLMAFPLLLTAIWLIAVLAKQVTPFEVVKVLLASTLLFFSLWIYGIFGTISASKSKRWFSTIQLIAALIVCYLLFPTAPLSTPQPTENISTNDGTYKDSFGLTWLKYSPEKVKELVAQGKPVFIDFTAAWCVTCHVNKGVVFGSQSVRNKFLDKGVILVRADWTNKDPIISQSISNYGRAGVPLNILYYPQQPDQPLTFPTLLTPGIVSEALDNL